VATNFITPRIVTRERRVFHCYYECPDCSRLGSEWRDVLLVSGPSWCPACDREADPYCIDEVLEYGPEFEDDEPELTDLDAEALS
jgi:hypothetical protein